MAIPANLDTVTVTGSYITADGTPASGTVSFTPTVWLRDDTGDVVVPQLPVVATLNASGAFTEVLIATDDTNVDQNWAYVVTETINGVTQTKTVLLPATSPTVDMAELEPVIDPTQYSDIRGPRGYSVLNGSGAPSAGTGEDGDFYYDVTTHAIYGPRTAGAWGTGTSLIGPQGLTGAPGPANSLSIGTVTTGAAGSSASATITGTPPSQTLALTIPRGDTGATGAPGADGADGADGAAATITVGTVTTGAPGSSAAVSNSGTPNAAVLDFAIPTGATGAPGADGADGADGAAATISVGSVTTGAPGSSAAVTNVGTSSAAVFNFTIPKGDTGDLGTLSGTAPITYSSNNIGIQVGTGLTVNAGSLVPDFGTTSGKVAQGNDSRFTDARTPTAHKASHATGGTDALSPADIGAIGTSALTSTNPAALGAAAAPGTSTDVARLDHVHARPTPADIGAVPASSVGANSGVASLDSAGQVPASQLGNASGGAKGGGTDKVFYENDQTVTTDYTITTNDNAMAVGPLAIATGITVTVPTGSDLVIV